MNQEYGKIFIAYKPLFESSNAFLAKIKRHLNIKKAGFSGILDPFAKGVLLVATGSYTKLLSHINIESKQYLATLWLGIKSRSLDIENIESVSIIPAFSEKQVRKALDCVYGKISYVPPIFSAKKIKGMRAYNLARTHQEVSLSLIETEVFSIQLINYTHPFITFSITLSKGGYVRSIGAIIANNLGVEGALCSLERISEGDISFANNSLFVKNQNYHNDILLYELNVMKLFKYPILKLEHLRDDFIKGKRLQKDMLGIKDNGCFIVEFEDFFSIIQVQEVSIKYLINRMKKC